VGSLWQGALALPVAVEATRERVQGGEHIGLLVSIIIGVSVSKREMGETRVKRFMFCSILLATTLQNG
jgi:hypothetical protein